MKEYLMIYREDVWDLPNLMTMQQNAYQTIDEAIEENEMGGEHEPEMLLCIEKGNVSVRYNREQLECIYSELDAESAAYDATIASEKRKLDKGVV